MGFEILFDLPSAHCPHVKIIDQQRMVAKSSDVQKHESHGNLFASIYPLMSAQLFFRHVKVPKTTIFSPP